MAVTENYKLNTHSDESLVKLEFLNSCLGRLRFVWNREVKVKVKKTAE